MIRRLAWDLSLFATAEFGFATQYVNSRDRWNWGGLAQRIRIGVDLDAIPRREDRVHLGQGVTGPSASGAVSVRSGRPAGPKR